MVRVRISHNGPISTCLCGGAASAATGVVAPVVGDTSGLATAGAGVKASSSAGTAESATGDIAGLEDSGAMIEAATGGSSSSRIRAEVERVTTMAKNNRQVVALTVETMGLWFAM